MIDCLFRQNHKENKETGICDMKVNIDATQTTTNIPDWMTIQELQQATLQDKHLQHL